MKFSNWMIFQGFCKAVVCIVSFWMLIQDWYNHTNLIDKWSRLFLGVYIIFFVLNFFIKPSFENEQDK